MNKVIKIVNIDGASYRVEDGSALIGVCAKCSFFDTTCPTDDTGKTSCYAYGDDAYFVAEYSKHLVEEFKEAAGITTEQTFTESQIEAAWNDLLGTEYPPKVFVKHLRQFVDPEYQEYMRLKAKFE